MGDRWFLGGLGAIALVAGGAAWWLARRRGAAGAFWWLPLVFCLVGVLGVTLALRAGGDGQGACVIDHQVTEPLYTTQGRWNLAMFVPLGLFGVLALRRPLPVLAGVSALPCVIELVQALTPFTSGICDSADVEMNAVGGVLGVAGALVLLRGRVAWWAWGRCTLVVMGVLALVGAGVVRTAVTFDHVDGSGVRDARGDEREVAKRVVRQAFGDRYEVGDVRIRPGLDGYNGWMDVQFAGGFPAELMWPGGRRLIVDFGATTARGFTVPGAVPPHGAGDAYRVARSYMRAHYPWAESASWHTTRPAPDDGSVAGKAWTVSWRFEEHGVAMPRSLDVRVDRAGHVQGLTVDFGPRHLDLPSGLMTARQAEQVVRKTRREGDDDSGRPRIHARELTTEQTWGNRGPWRAVWLVEVGDPTCEPGKDGQVCDPEVAHVDAAARRVVD
ncbi:VanZ family protein [Streptomyces sp. NPDC040750]|uniref:VanZ family protein n=1 Tax=Streptomyces sp. NPDC040750 TaxID=3154491 RepID=UPI0033EE2F00